MSGNQHRSPWTPKVIEKASKMWREGITSPVIVERMGGMFTVEALNSKARSMRDKFPIKDGTGKRRKISIPLEPIAKMWNDGKTSVEVGEHFGVKPSWVRSMAHQHRDLFSPKSSGFQKRTPVRKASPSPSSERPQVDVQRMPLPSAGTWHPIELDEYELARLPHAKDMFNNEGCKYPLSDKGPHLFCAHERYQLKPYCTYHMAKCNPPGAGTRSERRADRG